MKVTFAAAMSAQDPSVSSDAWLQTVRERQMATLSPEQQASLAERRERTQEQNQGRVAELQRRAGRIETCSAVSRAAWVGGMRNAFSQSPAAGPPAPASAPAAFSFGAAAPAAPAAPAPAVAAAQAVASTSAFGAIRSFAFGASSATSAVGASPAGISDHQFGQQVQTAMALGGFASTDAHVSDGEMGELLKQLETEPDSDVERSAKFTMFEQYADTLSDTRKAALAFWEEAKAEFDGSAKDAVEADIKAIDAHEHMGLHFGDQHRRWFVYDMVVQAHKNSQGIEHLVKGIRTKLELLASQVDCPICMECFAAEGAEGASGVEGGDAAGGITDVTTLGCCHKVCTDCWSHWCGLQRGAACCPLCRKPEFLQGMFGPQFGTPAAAANPFGAPAAAASPFGAPAAASNPFGAPAAAASPFGAPAAASNPFGAPAAAASPFGAPAAAANPFGAPAAAANPFGAPVAAAPANPFGSPAAFAAPPAYGNPSPFSFG
jgi:hypothetical protein